MKIVVKVAAWACGFCGALYRCNDPGKALALACCKCSTPGCDNRSQYTGVNGTCRLCLADKERVDAEESLVQAKERLRGAKQVQAHVRKTHPRRRRSHG